MNESQEFDHRDDQPLFDQLVDGELHDDQRRALLQKLDTMPDGWRQCALTFIEAQELRRVLPTLVSEEAAAEPRDVVHIANRSRSSTFHVGGLLAMAASFLVAFSLGLVLRGSWPSNEETAPRIVESSPATEAIDDTQLVHDQSVPKPLPQQQPAMNSTPVQPSHVWRDVALVANDGGEDSEDVRWPMAEGEDIDLQWLYRQPSALPRSVIEQIEHMGHEVNVVRELFPVRLRDGRQGIVPVDRVELRYVGNQTYQ